MNKKLKALALDDEPVALELLTDYATRLPFLSLEGVYTDPFAAMQHLKTNPVEVLFLDIQMPDLTGFQFLQTLQARPPAIIFTTAYRQYALEGFELDAADYLLKPYDFQRFAKAVNKAAAQLASTPVSSDAANYIFVKSEHQLVRLVLAEIRWLEAWGDYVKIYTGSDKPLLTLTSLQVFATVLPEQEFVRVHRSYLVRLAAVTLIQRGRIFIGDKSIPLGDRFATAFYERLPGPVRHTRDPE